MPTAFIEAADYLVIISDRPCWPAQLYLVDKYGHTLDSVLGKMSADKVEGHFGHVSKLAGGICYASVRQYMKRRT